MGRSRDIAKFLSSTEAENTDNNALLHTGSSVGVDSAQVKNIGIASYDTLDSLPMSGLVAGQQAFVDSARRLYISNGSGWFNVAVANATPQWDSGGEPDASYEIADSATPLIITARAIDSDNSNINLLNQSFGADSAQYMVDINNDSSVFTFTPKSADSIGIEVAAGNLADSNGDFTYTFKWSDGISFVSKAVNIIYNTVSTAAAKILNSNYTSILLAASGNGATNSSVTDNSANNHTVTLSGSASTQSFSPYRSGGYSLRFSGSSYLTVPYQAFQFGTGDFTVEWWGNHWSHTQYQTLCALGYTSTGDFIIQTDNNNSRWIVYGSGSIIAQEASDTTANTDEWYHMAVVRSSGTTKIYRNGVETGSGSDTTNYSSTSSAYIGIGNGANHLDAYVRDFRIVKGTAVYTSAFTPPTQPLTAITNTSLLTCHLPYVADGSSNGYTITGTGTNEIKPFSPYDYNPYDTTVHGGSLEIPVNSYATTDITGAAIGSQEFTIEFWFYPTNMSAQYAGVFASAASLSSNHGIIIAKDQWWAGSNTVDAQIVSGNKFPLLNYWYHVAVTRDSNNLIRGFVNGEQVGSVTDATSSWTESFILGQRYVNNTSYPSGGYFSDVRINVGTAEYTSAFTPPTQLKSTPNEVHLKVTDAGIFDKSQGAGITLVGNTSSSTTEAKYASSIYFDGTGDYVSVDTDTTKFTLDGDFTIEFWINAQDSTIGGVIANGASSFVSNAAAIIFDHGSNADKISFFAKNVQDDAMVTSDALTTDTWYHIAIVRSGSTITLYQDGVSKSTHTSSSTIHLSETSLKVGSYWNGDFYGYLEDVRITQGLARYTTNFTPPSESLQG